MDIDSRTTRLLQIGLTLFYGQLVSNGIYEYIIPGIAGLISRQRAVYDAVLLLILGILMITFVIYGIVALWYHRLQTSTIACVVLVVILLLTLAKSIVEIMYMPRHPLRTEWIVIRIIELILRVLGVIASVSFMMRLRDGYVPETL